MRGINESLLELMHAEIDGINSKAESERLEQLLSRDPETRTEFEELEALNATLAHVEPLAAPAGLRQDVIEALRNAPSARPAERRAREHRGATGRWAVMRYAYAVAAGVLLGVFGFQWVAGNLSGAGVMRPNDLGGTMTAPAVAEQVIVARRQLDLAPVSGTAQVARTARNYAISLDLDSPGPLDVSLGFDQQQWTFRGVTQERGAFGRLELEESGLVWTQQGRHTLTVVLEARADASDAVELTLSSDGDAIHRELFQMTGAR